MTDDPGTASTASFSGGGRGGDADGQIEFWPVSAVGPDLGPLAPATVSGSPPG